jgi:AraC-like DNA-binding protein
MVASIGDGTRRAGGRVDHADHVLAVATGEIAAPDAEQVTDSWRRSAKTYGVDPSSRNQPRILTYAELRDFREPSGKLIEVAQGELDHLYLVVQQTGYVVLLCDSHGIAIDHRGNDGDAERFKHWGLWLGGVWSEDAEGTNGIGTCIVEQRPITIHRGEHFRTRHTDLSCSGAPIFDADGQLTGVLDVSSTDPEVSERSHALALAVTAASAHAIEERLFRERFRRQWTIALMPPTGDRSIALLAVGRDEAIVGASRKARLLLALDGERLLKGVSLWSLFDRNPSLLRHSRGGDIAVVLTRTDRAEAWKALITPPESPAAWRDSRDDALHIRPRSGLLARVSSMETNQGLRGGLAPVVLHRVCEYIDSHLDHDLQLEILASIAGLSTSHFARAFRQAAGEPPHHYVLRRRIDRSREMLVRTDSPLSEIALANGFADQSHFARHFHRWVGIAPSTFRRTVR